MSTGYNPYATAQKQFDSVAEMIGLEPAVRELLRQPMREYHFTIRCGWTTGRSRSSRVTGSSIMMPGGRRKAYPFPPPGDRRYRPGFGHVDDLEVFGGGYPPGRGQRRYCL